MYIAQWAIRNGLYGDTSRRWYKTFDTLDSGLDIEAGRISNSGFKPFCKKYKNSQNSICQTLYNAQQNGQTWVFKSKMSASLMSSHHVHSDAGFNKQLHGY